jgi:hypothetical protein
VEVLRSAAKATGPDQSVVARISSGSKKCFRANASSCVPDRRSMMRARQM